MTSMDEEVLETRYGITGDFVKTYWHFAPDSIVFLNACWSAYTTDPQGPQDFIDACWSAGAGVYFGWSQKANSGTCFTAVRYFVDRLMGANRFMKENPDQRGFPWELVYDDMKSHGLTHDNVTGADLTPFPTARRQLRHPRPQHPGGPRQRVRRDGEAEGLFRQQAGEGDGRHR